MSDIIKNPVVAIAVFSTNDEETKTFYFQPITKSLTLNEFIDPITMGKHFKLESIIPLNTDISEVMDANSFRPLGYQIGEEPNAWEKMVKK